MTRILFTSIFIVILCCSCDKQDHQHLVTYQKRVSSDWPTDIIQLSDSGFVICTEGAGTYLIRTNSLGDTIWTRYFIYGAANAMTRTVTGGYLLGGVETNVDQDILLLKVDSNGNEIWHSSFDGSGRDYLSDIYGLPDGSSVATGYFNSESQMFVMRIDQNGDSLWCRVFPKYTIGNSLVVTNSNIIIAGLFLSETHPLSLLLAKLSLNGDVLAYDSLITANSQNGQCIVQTDSSFVVLNGHGTSSSLYKFTSSFDTMWTTAFTGYAFDLTILRDGGFVATGPFQTGPGIVPTLSGFSDDGRLQWQRSLPLESSTRVIETFDGGLSIIGLAQDGGYLLKTDRRGLF